MTATTLTVETEPESEPVTVAEAKRHLRIMSSDFDAEIEGVVTAAREWCENHISRTLREDVTRLQCYSQWPRSPFELPWPPLRSVTSIEYYDADDANQTLDESNYRVLLSTENVACVEWDADATLPDHATRKDAVRVTYVTGYEEAKIPIKAKQAILLYASVIWGDMSGRDLASAERAAKSLIDACGWGKYA